MFSRLILAAMLQTGLAFGAMACEGQPGNEIFSDTFPDDTGGWEIYKDRTSVVPPELLITLPQSDGWGTSTHNLTFEATEGDFCVEFLLPTEPLADDSYTGGGLQFWGTDYDNFYMLELYNNGKVGFFRRNKGTWQTIYEVPDAVTVRTAPEVNTLRAVAKGGRITTFVNGKEIKTVRAPIPQGAARFGFYAESGKTDIPLVFRFRGYRVTDGG